MKIFGQKEKQGGQERVHRKERRPGNASGRTGENCERDKLCIVQYRVANNLVLCDEIKLQYHVYRTTVTR
jgi:hypothetical protein